MVQACLSIVVYNICGGEIMKFKIIGIILLVLILVVLGYIAYRQPTNNFQTIQASATLVKDIVTGISAAIAAAVAVLGLQAWRKQLKGKTEYELAQRLLRAVYKLRDAIAWVRNPIQHAGEITQAFKEANIEGDPNLDRKIHENPQGVVIDHRWKMVQETQAELQSISLEAETLWGQDIKEKLIFLNQCVVILFSNLQLHFLHLERPPRNYDPDAEEKIEHIIYGGFDDPDENSFSSKINKSVSQIEDFLRPHLKI
jgi:hypothetical protein